MRCLQNKSLCEIFLKLNVKTDLAISCSWTLSEQRKGVYAVKLSYRLYTMVVLVKYGAT